MVASLQISGEEHMDILRLAVEDVAGSWNRLNEMAWQIRVRGAQPHHQAALPSVALL
jgi:hypothetical protein